MTNATSFYVLRGDYIDATRDAILSKYGSIDGYLQRGLGLSAREIAELRRRLTN